MRGALAADAQRAAGAVPTAQPFTRTTRRSVPTPPLRIRIACDVSGSMVEFAGTVASAAWILAHAGRHTTVATTTATVIFGEHSRDGREGAGRCVLDDGQGLDGTLGVGGRDGTSCLGLDGDARDVVGDGVVEFTSELFAFAGLGLVDVADADLRAIADRGAERGGEQEERVPCDRLRQAHGVGDVGDGQPEQDDAEAA